MADVTPFLMAGFAKGESLSDTTTPITTVVGVGIDPVEAEAGLRRGLSPAGVGVSPRVRIACCASMTVS